jgi:DNA-binding FrmR family transcriptional regulator
MFHGVLPFGQFLQSAAGVYFDLDEYTPYRYKSSMQTTTKAAVLKRLSRIEGQVRGLSRMVEEDRYCIDIMTQVSAVSAALRNAEEKILGDHLAHCVEHAVASGDKDDQRRKISEIIEVLGRSTR